MKSCIYTYFNTSSDMLPSVWELWPILINIFHIFPVILSIKKASEMDLKGLLVTYLGSDLGPPSYHGQLSHQNTIIAYYQTCWWNLMIDSTTTQNT